MHATVQEILQLKGTAVYAVSPAATVDEAVATMNDCGVGSVLVLHDGLVQGLVSERDILRRVVAQRLDPRDTVVTQIMTRRLWTVTPTTTIQQAMELVTSMRCRHLPVIGACGLAGLISSGDLAAWHTGELHAEVCDLTTYICGPASSPTLPSALYALPRVH